MLVHAVVHGWSLLLGRGVELAHLGSIGILRMSRLGCSLLAGGLSLLLLLNTRGRFVGGGILEVHGWHERPSELLLGDEWV